MNCSRLARRAGRGLAPAGRHPPGHRSAGHPPEERERLHPARLSELWRLHGKLAIAQGEPSRGIAFLARALKQAERAHDSRAIGLAHYELGLCYRQVGDTGIVREHIAQAASALHAAGDRAHLATRPFAVGGDARAGRSPRRSDGGAAACRASRADGPRRRRASRSSAATRRTWR